MEPLNYLRAATEDLTRQWMPLMEKAHPRDVAVCRAALKVAAASPKFVLPHGGRILNDNLRGLPAELRLPFPSVIIEYDCSNLSGLVEQTFSHDSTTSAPKRIVLACQESNEPISVYSILQFVNKEGYAYWAMQPFVAEIYMSDDPSLPLMEIQGRELNMTPLAFQMRATGTLAKLFGKDWHHHAQANMMDEIAAVAELIEALACSNVSHEALPVRKLNKGAAKRGALPFDEYRVLVVNGRKFDAPGTGSGGSHRSPREHLRRGHIRRLQDGRTVWVNSTIVNAGTAGKISKVYDVRSEVRAA